MRDLVRRNISPLKTLVKFNNFQSLPTQEMPLKDRRTWISDTRRCCDRVISDLFEHGYIQYILKFGDN